MLNNNNTASKWKNERFWERFEVAKKMSFFRKKQSEFFLEKLSRIDCALVGEQVNRTHLIL